MMKKSLIIVTIVALLAALTSGCTIETGQSPESTAQGQDTASLTDESTTTQMAATHTENEANFRLLVSDEVNAIEEFQTLNVTISRIGVHQGGESGNWTEYNLDPAVTVNLTELQGINATSIWDGNLEDGKYTKVFIYVDNVTGVLKENPEGEPTIKLPGGKLQISKSFDVTDGGITDFIFDITVIKAGNSGKYILKPQIAESGPHQNYIEVEPKGKTEHKGKPEDKGNSRKQKSGSSGKAKGIEIEDTIAPVITVSGISNGDNITGNVTISFEVSDDTDPEPAVNATLNDTPFVSGTEISEPGEYELEVNAVDASGNESEVTIEFEIKQE
ncbi:MAG: DUF4382 domain-containing protein [Dehalococcoidales bacterium]|nr:DUF4382 domain-containing protein [Dehalococcoidales bacterium]